MCEPAGGTAGCDTDNLHLAVYSQDPWSMKPTGTGLRGHTLVRVLQLVVGSLGFNTDRVCSVRLDFKQESHSKSENPSIVLTTSAWGRAGKSDLTLTPCTGGRTIEGFSVPKGWDSINTRDFLCLSGPLAAQALPYVGLFRTLKRIIASLRRCRQEPESSGPDYPGPEDSQERSCPGWVAAAL